MATLERETTERIFSFCMGLMPVLLVLFVINLSLVKTYKRAPIDQLPYLVGLGFFGIIQILVSLLMILAFVKLSDLTGILPKLALMVMAALLFFPMIIFSIEFFPR